MEVGGFLGDPGLGHPTAAAGTHRRLRGMWRRIDNFYLHLSSSFFFFFLFYLILFLFGGSAAPPPPPPPPPSHNGAVIITNTALCQQDEASLVLALHTGSPKNGIVIAQSAESINRPSRNNRRKQPPPPPFFNPMWFSSIGVSFFLVFFVPKKYFDDREKKAHTHTHTHTHTQTQTHRHRHTHTHTHKRKLRKEKGNLEGAAGRVTELFYRVFHRPGLDGHLFASPETKKKALPRRVFLLFCFFLLFSIP